jgi:Xaa-Pro aminopeptidase
MITHEKAALATDGRYFNQASKQLDSNWILLRKGMEDVPTWQEWYVKNTARATLPGTELRVGLHSRRKAARLSESILLLLPLRKRKS